MLEVSYLYQQRLFKRCCFTHLVKKFLEGESRAENHSNRKPTLHFSHTRQATGPVKRENIPTEPPHKMAEDDENKIQKLKRETFR